jgi:hypothetical protein
MPKLTNTFFKGRMNKDVDERLVPEGEYINALNVRVNSSQAQGAGTVEDDKGNLKITDLQFLDLPLSDSATCVGAFADSARETIYWFVTDQNNLQSNTNRVDMIVSLNIQTDELRYHIQSIEVLNFDIQYLIKGVNIVEDLLFWTDDFNPPRKININRSYPSVNTGGGPPATATSDNLVEADISVIVSPPTAAPAITTIRTAGDENYLETKPIAFAYRYKYLDGEYSALSQFSEVAFTPGGFRLDPATLLNEGMLNEYNTVLVDVDTGSSNVVGIDVCFKLADSNVINVIEKYNKDTEGWSDNSTETVTFKNSKIFTTLPSSEILRLYDNVPRFAKAQSVIGKRLVYGNYVDGYDLEDSNGDAIRIGFSAEAINTEVGFQSYDVTPSESVTYLIDGSESHPGAFSFDLEGFEFLEGSVLSFVINLVHSGFSGGLTGGWGPTEQQEPFSLELTFTLQRDYDDLVDMIFSDEFQAKIGTFPAYFEPVGDCADGTSLVDAFHCAIVPEAGFTLSGSGRTALNQGFKLEYGGTATEAKITVNAAQYDNGAGSTDAYEYFEVVSASVTSTLIGDKRSLHSNRDYDLAVIYMDDNLRASTALTSKQNTVFIKPENSITANSIRVTIPATMKPPSWATRYKWALKPSKSLYETIYGRIFYRDPLDGSIWMRLEGENQNKVEVGDKLIVKADSTGPVTELVTTKVLDKEAKAENFITADSITQLAGLYARFRPSGWSAVYDPDSFVGGDEVSFSTASWSAGYDLTFPVVLAEFIDVGTYPFVVYDLHDEASGTYTSWDIPAGSVVLIEVEFVRNRRGGSCERQECIFYKEIVASTDYSDFKAFWDGEFVDVTASECSATDGADPNDNEYFPTLYDVNTDPTSVFELRDATIGTNKFQFVTNSSLTGSPLWLAIRGGTPRCGGLSSRNPSVKARISITKANSTFIFETEPDDATPDVFFEGSEVFDITDGDHQCNVTNQDVSTGVSGVSDLGFFDCFTFGNGAESYKVEDSIIGNYFLLGQRVTAVSAQDYKEADRFASLTYSGVYNQESNVNKLNEFNLGLLNFKDLELSYGEIGIIKGRATDLLVLQEDRISYVLVGKNLLSDAVSGGAIATVPEVLGTQIARTEEYGIGLNNESFAEFGGMKFFVDAKRRCVIMLEGGSYSGEKLSVISNKGMKDWFRSLFIDNFNTLKIGAYDPFTEEYVLAATDTEIPVSNDCIPCGTIIRQYQEASQRRTGCIDLGTGTGEVSIDYRILDAATNLNIAIDYDGTTYSTGTVTADGSLTIPKPNSTPRTATYEIIPGGTTASFEVVLNCASRDAMSVIMVVVTSDIDEDKFAHCEFEWESGDYVSPTQSELVTADAGTGSIVSLRKTFTAPVGEGMIPPDGATLTMRYTKIGFDDLPFPTGGDLRYYKTNTVFSSIPADIATLLADSTSLSPLDTSGAPDVYENSFTVPAGTEQFLYLVFDLRRSSELLLCYNPLVRSDYSGGESVCCNCESGEGATYKPLNRGPLFAGVIGATAACAGDADYDIIYHNGLGLAPSIGDYLFSDTSGTPFTPAAVSCVKITGNQEMKIDTTGEILDIQDC